MTMWYAVRRSLTAVFFTVFFGLSAIAQDAEVKPSHLAVAKELLQTMRADQTMDQMITLILPQQVAAIKMLRPDIPKKALDRFAELFSAAFSRHKGEFIAAAAKTYARHLSEADMKNAIAFYNTETGRNFLDAQPAMMGELTKINIAMATQISKSAVQEAVRQLKKEGHDL